METIHAKVARRNYTYRGHTLPVGQVVRLTKAQFEKAQRIKPAYLTEATEAEVKKARTVIDLAELKAPKAENVAAAEQNRPLQPRGASTPAK